MTFKLKHSWTILFLGMSTFVSACSGCDDSGPTRPNDGGDTDGGALDATTSNDNGSQPDDGTDAGETCESGILCGNPVMCCAVGAECINGACMPACASGVRCGANSSVCCASTEVCLANECEAPTTACGDSYDCQPGEFCEPTLDRCLPQPQGGATCVYTPTFDTLEPTIEHMWTAQQILSIPVVADLDGDGWPEVVVNTTQQDGGGYTGGRIAVLDGRDLSVRVPPIPNAPAAATPTYGSHGRRGIALGDVNGDGRPDIVYTGRPDGNGRSLVVAITMNAESAVEVLWTSHALATPMAAATPYRIDAENGALTLANLDGDAMAEIVAGAMIFDHDGRLIWDAGTDGSGAAFGSNSGYEGGIAVVHDLDQDGDPEIITGRRAYKVAWTAATETTLASAVITPHFDAMGNDGYPAVADIDEDGSPEVVLVGSNQVRIVDGQNGMPWCVSAGNCVAPLAIPGGAGSNRGGPPTIADFDGDGRPEIGVAGGHSYSVYDIHRLGEDLVYPNGDPEPALGALYVRWSRSTQDTSSNTTGSSVFDFQGDGAAEVVYADECYLRVYSGTDGDVQLEVPSSSATVHEYPLVVDADGDGNSEILLVSNDSGAAGNCGAGVPTRRGIFMYGDTNDQWVPTRRVWTQHAYHVTNATSAGNVPMSELPNWTQPGLNNARQNVQGDGVFNAPDLAVDASVSLAMCPDTHQVRARVTNLGALGVYMGVPVRFERTTGGTTVVLGTLYTTMPLLPGQSEVLTFDAPVSTDTEDYRVVVDFSDGGDTDDVVNECNESNNTSVASGAGCIIFG